MERKKNYKDDCFSKRGKNTIFFNSVSGEEINVNDCEEEMYEIIPDLEQYAQDNITQFVDINENDKQFFKLWNSFIKSNHLENKAINFEKIIINFIKNNAKELYEKNIRKNFILHLVCIYDNNQISDDNLKNIIDKMDEVFEEYTNK